MAWLRAKQQTKIFWITQQSNGGTSGGMKYLNCVFSCVEAMMKHTVGLNCPFRIFRVLKIMIRRYQAPPSIAPRWTMTTAVEASRNR